MYLFDFLRLQSYNFSKQDHYPPRKGLTTFNEANNLLVDTD